MPPRRHLSICPTIIRSSPTANCLVLSGSLLAITFSELQKDQRSEKNIPWVNLDIQPYPGLVILDVFSYFKKPNPCPCDIPQIDLGDPPPPQDSPARTSGMSVRPRLTALTECANLAAELQKCIVEASSNHLRCQDKEYV